MTILGITNPGIPKDKRPKLHDNYKYITVVNIEEKQGIRGIYKL